MTILSRIDDTQADDQSPRPLVDIGFSFRAVLETFHLALKLLQANENIVIAL